MSKFIQIDKNIFRKNSLEGFGEIHEVDNSFYFRCFISGGYLLSKGFKKKEQAEAERNRIIEELEKD